MLFFMTVKRQIYYNIGYKKRFLPGLSALEFVYSRMLMSSPPLMVISFFNLKKIKLVLNHKSVNNMNNQKKNSGCL
jgi:hypothetical protein